MMDENKAITIQVAARVFSDLADAIKESVKEIIDDTKNGQKKRSK